MLIRQATIPDIAHVATRMRTSDVREFSALLPVDTRDELAQALVKRYGVRDDIIVACNSAGPVAIGAAIEARPNVVTLAFFATDDLVDIGQALTRFLKQRFLPELKAAGVHRFECVSIVGHHEAHKWIESLGLEVEAVCRAYGKDREDFIQFAWVGNVDKARN